MLDAFRHRRDVHLFVGLPRGIEADMLGGRLHLDDVGAEKCRHVGGVGADVDGGFGFLVEHRAAGVGPQHDGEAGGFGLFGEFAEFLHHGELVLAARIDGEADGGAAEAQGVGDRAGDGLVLFGGEGVGGI